MPGYGRLLISPFPTAGTERKLPITRHFNSLPPFAIHILDPLEMRIHRDPLYMEQNAPRNAWKQILLRFGANVGHSVSP